jgi:hypothetical protein
VEQPVPAEVRAVPGNGVAEKRELVNGGFGKLIDFYQRTHAIPPLPIDIILRQRNKKAQGEEAEPSQEQAAVDMTTMQTRGALAINTIERLQKEQTGRVKYGIAKQEDIPVLGPHRFGGLRANPPPTAPPPAASDLQHRPRAVGPPRVIYMNTFKPVLLRNAVGGFIIYDGSLVSVAI